MAEGRHRVFSGLVAGIVGAVILAGVEAAWHYAANHAELDAPAHTAWKGTLFGVALAIAVLVPAAVALGTRDRWWRPTAIAGSLTVTGAGMLAWVTGWLVGDRHGGNSALIGEPTFVRFGAGLTGYVLMAILSGALSVAVGWGVRLVSARLRQPDTPGGQRASAA